MVFEKSWYVKVKNYAFYGVFYLTGTEQLIQDVQNDVILAHIVLLF